jgi:hypothetical protein
MDQPRTTLEEIRLSANGALVDYGDLAPLSKQA